MLRAHIDPAIGGKPIGVIRRGDIKALIAGMHRKGLSASRIGCAHLVISAVLAEAVRDKKLASSGSSAVVTASESSSGAWGAATALPGIAAGDESQVDDLICVPAGDCTVVGSTIRTGRIRTRSSRHEHSLAAPMEERCPERPARTVSVASEASKITLSRQDLREVTRYAAESAQCVLEIFETAHPADSRPRDAIDAAWTFARGGERGKALRDAAWAALKAARDAGTTGAGEAARAAMFAASAAYLHPLASAYQVKHILGAAAHAARAAELMAGDDQDVGAGRY